MAVEFTQRVVDALATTFAASYPAALTNIDAALAGVDAYYKFPQPVIGGGTVFVEFYENNVEFTEPYTDRDSGFNTFEGFYSVRITLQNSDNAEAETMVARIRKYASAAIAVIRDVPTLGDGCIIDTVAESWSHAWDVDGEDEGKKFKLRGILTLRSKVQETV